METNNVLETTGTISLTIGEKLKCFFTNPNKVFAEYNIKPTWFVKFLIITAITVATTLITKALTFGPKVDLLIQQTPDISKEQAEAMVQFMNSPLMTGLAVGGSFITVVAAIFLGSLIYYGLISLFNGKTTYMKIVSVYSLAYIPASIGGLVTIAFAYYTNSFESLLQPKFMDMLFKRLDLFVIWQALLLIFGFAKVANLKLEKSAIIVVIMWIAATGASLVSVALAGLR